MYLKVSASFYKRGILQCIVCAKISESLTSSRKHFRSYSTCTLNWPARGLSAHYASQLSPIWS